MCMVIFLALDSLCLADNEGESIWEVTLCDVGVSLLPRHKDTSHYSCSTVVALLCITVSKLVFLYAPSTVVPGIWGLLWFLYSLHSLEKSVIFVFKSYKILQH